MESCKLLDLVQEVNQRLLQNFDIEKLKAVSPGRCHEYYLARCVDELYRMIEIGECALNGVEYVRDIRGCENARCDR